METAEALDTTPGGLPRRRSIRNDIAGPQPGAADRRETVAAVPPDASFTGLAAFATAGRASGPPREMTTDRDAGHGRRDDCRTRVQRAPH